MKNTKKLTLLHSNDMHGDFMESEKDGIVSGGVSRLSGYVQKVRQEEENVIYAIAGDMFRGSVIDSEFRGVSTIEIMNMIAPNVVTMGNHEADYGVSHLLFLEKCASFPIINANMYIKSNGVRLFPSHYIHEVDDMKILFIGILTEEVLSQTKLDEHVGTLIDVEDAAVEVGRICDSFRSEDVDFTVLLTHIGLDADIELAKKLDPRWGVDIIIGGHSHTLMEKPEVINGIPIVQAASGTKQIGRFDIVVDTDKNCIDSYEWKLIPIDEENCPRDYALEDLIKRFKNETDKKYCRLITRFVDKYTHPTRYKETQLGHIFADLFRDGAEVDLMLMGSGSIRVKELGPLVQYKDLVEAFPFDDVLYRAKLTGRQVKKMLFYIVREDAFIEEKHCEFYQLSEGWNVTVSRSNPSLNKVTFNGKEVDDDEIFNVGLQQYHYKNCEASFNMTQEELEEAGKPRTIATSCKAICGEWMSLYELIKLNDDERMTILE
ncbi:MAG: bifunctional metallophosphatase/5'-nucleotidase [Lachnospiraceae bacterium]|nr:bifunctional metallophosphatase/5'-nucleotidase [Lachnospiraceae bacterium]